MPMFCPQDTFKVLSTQGINHGIKWCSLLCLSTWRTWRHGYKPAGCMARFRCWKICHSLPWMRHTRTGGQLCSTWDSFSQFEKRYLPILWGSGCFKPPKKYTQLETTWQDDNIKQKTRNCILSLLTFFFKLLPGSLTASFPLGINPSQKGKSSFNHDFSRGELVNFGLILVG